eukprot:XP_003726443.1 PREDICTED: uncharacterized protein LOC100888772 [Strongylocentrotus purpuratus]
MEIIMTLASVVCVLLLSLANVEGLTDLYLGDPDREIHVGSDIEIVCDSDLQRSADMNDDELRRKIGWLRGGPVVEDLEVVASSDSRVSIEMEFLSERTFGFVEVRSTLTIRRAALGDSTNYTCCKRDTPMCDEWRQRQQRQLQVEILPTQTAPELTIMTTMTRPSQEWTTRNPVEPSTISTTFSDEIQDHTVIPMVNEAFHQKQGAVYTIAIVLPCVLAVILVIVVTIIARHYWRRKNVDTPVQVFEA